MKQNLVAILGTGTIAQGIAMTVARNALDVIIYDESEDDLKEALKGIEFSIDREIEKWGMTESEKRAVLSRIETTTVKADLANAAIFFESKGKSEEEKKELISNLDFISDSEALLIMTTTTISVTEVSKILRDPSRLIGLHFIHPVYKVPIVEVVKGLKTSAETVKRTKQFLSDLGREYIEVFEYPGYVTTRVILPLLNEAMHVLMEGLATAEDIDKAIRLGYDMSMGPLALADYIGLDYVLEWLESLFKELGEAKFRPCPLLRKLVREEKLGLKTGEGFFKYDKEGKRVSK
ncbi:3-hydroxybutyryl-CoA dehydrogenase [Thermotomaculum hydrothermale]|uniref:3-hydroxybutyryl-CoA dehydrogenase n=1 Tax=Thermotomaculum hydrothermale TaxID=981385 RepID=A0A7R6PXD1_9BACT|nr:3-hydroxyacyl-CoA dehydrogenase NAD-binding domain-containing protein [Thermotomaculum hydrothermale]BBB32435.1 3-hydroxybutyryl-CoA dehydrogenase [Thermotomaculum hydrothermale]